MHGIQNDFIVSQENLSGLGSTSMNKPPHRTALKFLRTQILNYCYDNCDSELRSGIVQLRVLI